MTIRNLARAATFGGVVLALALSGCCGGGVCAGHRLTLRVRSATGTAVGDVTLTAVSAEAEVAVGRAECEVGAVETVCELWGLDGGIYTFMVEAEGFQAQETGHDIPMEGAGNGCGECNPMDFEGLVELDPA